jgi:prophage maintenance system killer protein
LRRPTLHLAVEFNRAVREEDEWFEEADDLPRVQRAIDTIADVEDPVDAAAVLAYRIVRAQAFGEGNKRTALLLARWLLDRNGVDGASVLPADDRDFADLLVKASAGQDVESKIVDLFNERRRDPST